ncbi:MAG: hypothetical protein MOIL_00119 [Candidatus Methanolliviera sp. GoM_oil]|nr:MAG: hypothetical protein MOIL_00119 [Candidatus Methanolliviera sp. GoM_oil]
MDEMGMIQSMLGPKMMKDLIKMIQPFMTPEFMRGVGEWATWMADNPGLIKTVAETMGTK